MENSKIDKELELFKHDSFYKLVNSYIAGIENEQNYIKNALMQPNEISRASYGMSLAELKTFSYLIKTFMTENRDSLNRSFTFNLKEILTNINLTTTSGTGKTSYINTLKKLLKIQIFIENETKFRGMNIFENIDFDKETNIVTFVFTETFAKILERKDGGKFTLLNFEEMITLESFYAMRFYQFAMSFKGFKGKFKKPNDEWFKENIKDFKNTWIFGYSINQLKFLFGISDKYKGDNKNFLIKVIEKPFEELSKKIDSFDFKYQIVRKNDRPNGKIEGFLFWITEKKSESKKFEKTQESVAYSPFTLLEAQKRDLENEVKPIFDLQEKYPEEFEKRLNEEKSKNNPFAFEIVLKKNVYDSMIADGFNI